MFNDSISPEVRELLSQLPPGWEAWRGVGGILYARRRKSSPPTVVRGATVAEVATQAAEKEHERAGGN